MLKSHELSEHEFGTGVVFGELMEETTGAGLGEMTEETIVAIGVVGVRIGKAVVAYVTS
jgi:hypothetical protein